jgi:hypothetical protein
MTFKAHGGAGVGARFSYPVALSTAKRLVFVQEGTGLLAWALMIGKNRWQQYLSVSPIVIVIDCSQRKKLKNANIIFKNMLGERFRSQTVGPLCMGTELLFHFPRSGRLNEFYAPFVEEASAVNGLAN